MHLGDSNGRRAMAAGALVALMCATTAAVAGCGEDAGTADAADEATVTVEHAQGSTDVPERPGRVVTFDMASLDTIDALGAGDSVVGVPTQSVPAMLGAYAGGSVVDAGTLFEPDYEAVAAAEPDVIIVAGRSAPAYSELAEIAPTIDLTVDQGDILGSFAENTEALGEVFGKQDAAAAGLAEIDAAVAEVKEKATDAGTGLIVMSSGGKLTAYGPGSRFGLLHDELGIAPAKDDIAAEAQHGEAASFEYVLEANPDWLFVVDRDSAIGEEGATPARAVLDNPLVARTSAWREDQVVYLDSTRWYIVGSGLGTIRAMVDEIDSALDG